MSIDWTNEEKSVLVVQNVLAEVYVNLYDGEILIDVTYQNSNVVVQLLDA